jgi:hypothetical protein
MMFGLKDGLIMFNPMVKSLKNKTNVHKAHEKPQLMFIPSSRRLRRSMWNHLKSWKHRHRQGLFFFGHRTIAAEKDVF